ncbi:poly(R)-hydroxyalkanoic acid synthase [Brevundimonas sp. GN22]
MEQLSLNLAKAAMLAQSAVAEAALTQADRPAALSADPFNVTPAMGAVMTSLAAKPEKLFQAQADLFNRYMGLWSSATRRAWGQEDETPPATDKRFRDPAWSENPLFDMMRQSYLTTSDWMNNLVASAEDIDPKVKRQAQFFTRLLTDALSPANFLASNPVALKALTETNGESLVRGMQNFASDLERGRGRLSIRQTDDSNFKVGETVATTPGQVVWRDELFELLQYAPTTEQQHSIPLLIFPPWINKFYILDLQPSNSMVRWLTAQGFSVFICSWVNPDKDKASLGFDDYLEKGIYRAIEKVLEQTGQKTTNTVGYCIGGTLLGAALAHAAANKDTRINSATFFAAQHDFSEAGDLTLFTDEHWLAEIERQMDEAGGVLPSTTMAETFNALRSNDLIWSFFVSNYLMGKSPQAFDLLAWNSDQTRMPKALHLAYLRLMYGQNSLAKGELTLKGTPIKLDQVKIPLYFQASREDHIAPMRSVYRSAKLFGGPVTFTLAGSGHIAGVINHPDAVKYQHWTNSALPETVEEWQADAEAHPGSWWPHWANWLAGHSGKMVTARDPQKGPLAPLEPAPGSYVKVKS